MAKSIAYIALGSNIPFEGVPAPRVLARAVSEIERSGFTLLALSGLWESAAWPPSDQPDYYNAVVALDPAGLSPQALYAALRDIELNFGRERREPNAARTLDLDIVAMDGRTGAFGAITLPHPRMHERAFVLAPMDEVAPDWRHPETGLSPSEMLDLLPPGHRYRRLSDLGTEAG
jgi:2-amino-4-hydroxy-6-hydroxymethyldihydropteridine diphosphokinase